MKRNKKILFISFLIFSLLLIVLNAKAIASNIPTITTACETKNGELLSFSDGFSWLKKCTGTSRRVILLGQQGEKGDKGEKGDQGLQGEPGKIDDSVINDLSTKIGGLDSRVATLEAVVNNEDFHVNLSNESYGNYGAWWVKVKITADWKDISLTDDITNHGTLHAGAEYPFTNTGVYITVPVALSFSTNEVTLDTFITWHGMVKHIVYKVTAPAH